MEDQPKHSVGGDKSRFIEGLVFGVELSLILKTELQNGWLYFTPFLKKQGEGKVNLIWEGYKSWGTAFFPVSLAVFAEHGTM